MGALTLPCSDLAHLSPFLPLTLLTSHPAHLSPFILLTMPTSHRTHLSPFLLLAVPTSHPAQAKEAAAKQRRMAAYGKLQGTLPSYHP